MTSTRNYPLFVLLAFALILSACSAAPEATESAASELAPTCSDVGTQFAAGRAYWLTFEAPVVTLHVLGGTAGVSKVSGYDWRVVVFASDGSTPPVVGHNHAPLPAVEIRACVGSQTVYPTNIEVEP